ncbi:hypothetical protein [Devosia sp. XK-2]|uniref:hypothetical protein n=1 Tax=Devosia sp. XK-2 TaxID=3126689 RepID=UPI0030D524EF
MVRLKGGAIQQWWYLRGQRKLVARLRREAHEKLEKAKAEGMKADELNRLSDELFWDFGAYADRLDELESQRLIARAQRWGVPIPPRSDDSPYWYKSGQLWTWALSDEGKMKLRHEIAAEVEIAHKPWLNWSALIISLFSLAVAIAALFNGGAPPNVSP